jgi:hypothetical protein
VRRHARLVALLGLLGIGAVGCSTTPPASRAAHGSGPPTTAGHTPSGDATHDVAITSCTRVGAYWLLDGSVRNHSTTAHRYKIVVGFDVPPGRTTVDTREIDTGVIAPGASTTWGASGAKDHSNVSCVIKEASTVP